MCKEPVRPDICTSATHPPLPIKNARGEVYCFNCVVEAYQTQMYNLVAHIVGSRDLAEDVTQEALISAYRAFGGFRGGNLRSWLMRIAANGARNVLRSLKARPSVSLDAMEFGPLESSPSSEEEPEEYTLRQELARTIEQGLAALPPEQKLAVVLVDIQGSSYEEAAQIMRTSLGTVKSRISRGRASMRDFLRTQGELLPSVFRHNR